MQTDANAVAFRTARYEQSASNRRWLSLIPVASIMLWSSLSRQFLVQQLVKFAHKRAAVQTMSIVEEASIADLLFAGPVSGKLLITLPIDQADLTI